MRPGRAAAGGGSIPGGDVTLVLTKEARTILDKLDQDRRQRNANRAERRAKDDRDLVSDDEEDELGRLYGVTGPSTACRPVPSSLRSTRLTGRERRDGKIVVRPVKARPLTVFDGLVHISLFHLIKKSEVNHNLILRKYSTPRLEILTENLLHPR